MKELLEGKAPPATEDLAEDVASLEICKTRIHLRARNGMAQRFQIVLGVGSTKGNKAVGGLGLRHASGGQIGGGVAEGRRGPSLSPLNPFEF